MGYDAPQELLEILADPETKGPLRLATEAELTRLKQALEAGEATRKDGKAASATFEAAFLAQEGAVAYVVEEGIPVFLIDERLELDPKMELDMPIEAPSSESDDEAPPEGD